MRTLSDAGFSAISTRFYYGLIFVAGYIACAFLGIYLSIAPASFVSFWLPGGLFLGALLRVPTRNWPAVIVLALLANGIFDSLNHQPPQLILAFSVGNALAATLAAALSRRFIGFQPRLGKVTEVLGLIVAVMIGSLVSASIGLDAISLTAVHSPALGDWLFWWSGDVLGTLLLAPLILTAHVSLKVRWQQESWKRHLELLALVLTACLMSEISFSSSGIGAEVTTGYLIIACMLWATIRFDLQVTGFVTLLIAVLITVDSKQNVQSIPPELLRPRIVLLQMLLTTSVLLGLFLSALLEERRSQERQLREKNLLLEESQRIAQVGTWSWEPSTGNIVWSEETYRIFGVDRQSFKPTVINLVNLVVAEDRNLVQRWLEEGVLTGSSSDIEYRCLTPAGEIRTLRGQGEWQPITQSGTARIIGTVQNITERKRAAAALLESEQKFESVFRHLPIWISIRNLNDSTYVEINEQALHDLGYSREEIIGCSAKDIGFMSAEDRTLVQQRMSTDGRFSGLEVTVEAKDGRKIRTLANGEKIFLNGQPCVLIVAIDISARRRLEQELSERAAQLRIFIESSSIALAMFDHDMRYMHASRGWRETFALGDADLSGRSHYEIFPDIPDFWKDVHRRGIQGEVISADEDRFERANGQVQWVRWEVRPWHHADNSVGGIVIFTEDITARKQAEAAVVERDAMLQQVGELARVGATMLDLRTNKYYWSSAMFSIHEMEGSNPPPIESRMNSFPAEIRPLLQSASRALMESGKAIDMEVPIITAKGNSIWARVQGSPVYENGKVIKILGAYQDITSSKQAELALRASEERLRTLLDNLQVGVVVQDPAAQVTWCNRMALKLLGLTRDQLLGRTSFDTDWNIIREDGSTVQGHEQPGPQVAATGKPVHGLVLGVYRPSTRSRVWVQVDAEPEFNSEGSLKQIICSFGDITAHKQAEIALRESEERFRQIAENIHEVFWVLDIASFTVTYVSPAYEKIWGRKVEDVYQHPRDWLQAVVVEDRQRVAAAFDRIATEGSYLESYRITRPDGQVRWIRDQGFAVRDANDAVLRVVGTAQDITEAREIENQLRRSQRLESIGTLTGGIAHDFNNILAGILGFAALAGQVAEQPDLNRADLKNYLAHINRAGKRASDLVAQILTFSRSSSPAFTVIHMNELVGEAIKLLRAAIPSSIEFDTRVDVVPPISGNASQLHQVVMNLGTNAWQAMRDLKGRLSITLDAVAVDDSQARALAQIPAGNYVHLSVQDTGHGMNAETLERIFEPFYTTKPAGQGTGLGLSVVHGIVRGHRGIIKVDSELNRGTTFEIFFPIDTDQSTTGSSMDQVTSSPRGHGQSILLVDDEPALVQLGEHTLKHLGYKVTGDISVLNALRRIEQHPGDFDLIITDQTMPGMTGIEFATRIHALRPTLPVLLISGYTAALSSEQIKAAGISDILDKPYTNAALAAAIHRQFVNRE